MAKNWPKNIYNYLKAPSTLSTVKSDDNELLSITGLLWLNLKYNFKKPSKSTKYHNLLLKLLKHLQLFKSRQHTLSTDKSADKITKD